MKAMFKHVFSNVRRTKYLSEQLEKQRVLSYLKVKPLHASTWNYQKRNAKLIAENELEFSKMGPSVLAFKHARRLENREYVSLMEGCYGISERRAARHVGALSTSDFGEYDAIDSLDLKKQEHAKQFRLFGYTTINSVSRFIEFQNQGGFAQCAVNINSDWYDPPNGVIPMPTESSVPCGAHSFSPYYEQETRKFIFDNSWGPEWGDLGSGEISYDYFAANVVEMMGYACSVEQLPVKLSETSVVGWKWRLSETDSFHCREIIDGATNDRIAWSFGKRSGNELAIYEFFVWPTYRSQGFGARLAELMLELARHARLSPRLEVPFADTPPANLDALLAVGKLFGVTFEESTNPFYSLDGIRPRASIKQVIDIKRASPPRAASPLEWLRRKSEQPLVQPVVVPVLFGTNRAPSGEEGEMRFTGKRGDKVTYGFTSIRVENIEQFGSKGRSWLARASAAAEWLKTQLDKHGYDGNRINIQSQDSFSELINHLYAHEESRRHLVYVHGFNTSFDIALQHAARLKADLKLSGNVFLYSWPSAGKPTAYSADEAAIEASLAHFSDFMNVVRNATADDSLSVLAHSMGNRLLANWIASKKSQQLTPNFHSAIFAAPDVDHDVFRNTVGDWSRLFETATLYANSADLALQLSELKHAYARAGLVPPVVNIPGLDTILIQGFDLFDLAHGYFAEAGNTLHDMFVLLNFKATAKERAGTRRIEFSDGTFCWALAHK